MIDCSHANSNKDHNLQPLVLENVCNQILDGNKSIVGVMIESNLNGGNQKLSEDLSQLEYGVSVTDACIDWETTKNSILSMAIERILFLVVSQSMQASVTETPYSN